LRRAVASITLSSCASGAAPGTASHTLAPCECCRRRPSARIGRPRRERSAVTQSQSTCGSWRGAARGRIRIRSNPILVRCGLFYDLLVREMHVEAGPTPFLTRRSKGAAFKCKIWCLISRTVSEDDAHRGNMDDCSVRAFAVKPSAFGGGGGGLSMWGVGVTQSRYGRCAFSP
jgi:hypothetical protein